MLSTLVRASAIVLLVAVIAASVALIVGSSHFPECENQAEAAYQYAQHADEYPSFARLISFLGCFVEKAHEPITAVSTFAIAIFTILLALIAVNQTSETHILERAYVSAEPHGIHSMIIGPPALVAHVKFVNAGRLPARNVSWKIKAAWFWDARHADFDVNRSELSGDNVIIPGGQMIQGGETLPRNRMLAEQDYVRRHKSELKTSYLYIYGLVSYNDGFNKTRETRFCHRYNCAIFDRRKGSIDAERGRQHRYGNSAT